MPRFPAQSEYQRNILVWPYFIIAEKRDGSGALKKAYCVYRAGWQYYCHIFGPAHTLIDNFLIQRSLEDIYDVYTAPGCVVIRNIEPY